VWEDRHRLIEDVSRVSAELALLAETASARFPAEPEAETTPLPELPSPGPRFGDPIEDDEDEETLERRPDPASAADPDTVPPPPPPPPADSVQPLEPEADDFPPAAGPQ
jgi:hypothetical protein